MADQENGMDAGRVAIELEGETVYLVPTPASIRAICREYGGMDAAFNHVRSGNALAFEFIIEAGLGPENLSPKELRQLPDKIFRAGYIVLTEPVSDFLGILLNGGRPLPPDPKDDDEGDDDSGEVDGV